MSDKDKWVRRFSVDETAKHEKGFTIYKITSVLFPIDSPEAVTVISVWKRYSDVQTLHKSIKSLHSGLHLKGIFPELPKFSYFKRFDDKVIQERAKSIKILLEFVAEHKLLFTSTDFVNFLQTGYPEPKSTTSGSIIKEIRTSLHLPLEDAPVLDYRASDDDNSSPRQVINQDIVDGTSSINELIPQIPIYEAADVEIRSSPKTERISQTTLKNSQSTTKFSQPTHGSCDSLDSLESIGSDLYDNISKISIEKPKFLVKNNNKKNLPDLINFDEPSTSFDNNLVERKTNRSVSVTNTDSETFSLSSNTDVDDTKRSVSRVSITRSFSEIDSKVRTESSYVFEAGYILNLAARCEDLGDYNKAFDYYKCGIEKMLIGVKSDPDPQRRALIKEKTNKYLSYAEDIYRNHLGDNQEDLPSNSPSRSHTSPPLARSYEHMSSYSVAAPRFGVLLVLHNDKQTFRVIKIIQKIPINLTEFDDHFLKNVSETRKPILPTNIPYMVPLKSYVETSDSIFLILSYAPGEKLIDYIKNYVNSTPNTPLKQNLDNVFNEPLRNLSDNIRNVNDKNDNKEKNEDQEILELVMNSQKLINNVDKALRFNKELREKMVDGKCDVDGNNESGGVTESTVRVKETKIMSRAVIPPSAICKWGAEILTALESLHDCGVICRDLNPNNILLSDGGQIILTYFISYPGLEMSLKTLTARLKPGQCDLYMAPELYYNTILDENSENGDFLEKCCDFWSFGAVMYELICGVPLSHYHNSRFTSHTILCLPDGLDYEAQSLLTQLLTFDPAERLGSRGVYEIKQHPYFKNIDWKAVYEAWIEPD